MRLSLIFLLFLSPGLSAFNQTITAPADEPIIHQIYQLVDQRNPTSPIFEQALKHSDPQIQEAALLGLARIGGKTIIHQITPFLKSDNESLRKLAAFALGLSANKEAAYYLWQHLEQEQSELVRQEMYLALGNLGQNNLITKMMQRLTKEKSRLAKAAIFQGLGIALTFHRDLKDDYSQLDFQKALRFFSVGDNQAARAGLFLSRVPKIETYIKASDLLPLTQFKMTPLATTYLARLIGKVTVNTHTSNRALLAWLIETSESDNLSIKLEAIHALKNLINIPQTQIQLGKLHISANPIVAQTALKVIADSELNNRNVTNLLKKQLKSKTPAMVVEAMSGLIKRQNKDDMTWVMKLINHPDSYVKISLMALLKNKPDSNFDNLYRLFSKSPDKKTSQYAQSLLTPEKPSSETQAESPSYSEAIKTIGKKVELITTTGNIIIELLPESPFTNWHFINNIQQSYFNQSYFNRVIGNFVAQGGDSIGDGSGSSGQTIREEINFYEHRPMSVGMATAGKDTGSSQFFINTGRNLHLDRNYTVFGKVISGQDIVLKMTHGTQILEAKVN